MAKERKVDMIFEALLKYTGCFVVVLLYQVIAHNINLELCSMAAFVMCVFMELSEEV